MARTRTETVYTASELRDHDRAAFNRAWQRYCSNVYDDPAWSSEHGESLGAALAAVGDNPPVIDGPTGADDVRRCMAWLENNILSSLRIGYSGAQRSKVARYGCFYRPGMVKPCPWTGYCADETMLDALRQAARSGVSPHEWPRILHEEADRAWEQEVEWQASEDAFVEAADANEWEFCENGERA